MSIAAAMPIMPGASLPAAGQSVPSTDGFLQALDQFLSSADQPQGTTGSSSLSALFGMDTFSVSSAFAPAGGTDLLTESDTQASEGSDLADNPVLCQQLAGILQILGFQVRPEDIASLSPLDAKQLDSAMEFVERNLERGADPSEIAECTALLLPRAWPLDDLDGAPVSAGQAPLPAAAGKLPEGFSQTVESARENLAQTTTPAAESTKAVATDKPSVEPSDIGSKPVPATKEGSAKQGSQQGLADHPEMAWTRPQETFQTALAAETQDPKGTRHLPPGGMASELIGRQVLEKVHVQLAEGRRELSLRLWPEELGEVRLSLRMSDGNGIQANMVVENDAVRQAMLDSMPQLRDALSRHGLDLEKMTVSVGTGGSAMAGSGSEADGKKGGEGAGNRRGGGFRETEIAVATTLQLGRDTGHRNGKNSIEIWS